jgi:hypothetical protein
MPPAKPYAAASVHLIAEVGPNLQKFPSLKMPLIIDYKGPDAKTHLLLSYVLAPPM